MAYRQWTAGLLVYAILATLTESDARNLVAKGNNDFALHWYKIRGAQPGNVVISPFSAEMVLAMLSLGADGTTFSQLAQGLHLPGDKDIIAKDAQSLLNSACKVEEGNNTLSIANRIYSDSRFDIKNSYKNKVKEYFSSEIVLTDFAKNPEESRKGINQWVEEESQGKIKDLLPNGVITTDTRTVLVNTMYFKGKWSVRFNSRLTRSEPFYSSCNEITNVDMMRTTSDVWYADFPDFQAVKLDYEGEDFNMLILLPKECEDGKTLEKIVEKINLKHVYKSLRETKLRLSVPKFTIEDTVEMNNDLKMMGMVDMFGSTANFSGISDEPTEVSAVLQKTFIEVSEEGTEAKSATGIVVNARSLRLDPVFRANQPFLFIIQETSTEVILFIGRYMG